MTRFRHSLPLSAHIRQYAPSTLRRPLFSVCRFRNINLITIGFPYRVHLRIRLTLF